MIEILITEPLITAHDTAVSSLQCNSSLTARHARFRLEFPELRSNFAYIELRLHVRVLGYVLEILKTLTNAQRVPT